MPDRFAHKLDVAITRECDSLDRTDSVNEGDDALECEVPVGVDDGGDGDGEEGDVIAQDFGWRGEGGEEFYVEGVEGGVEGGHAFGVVV